MKFCNHLIEIIKQPLENPFGIDFCLVNQKISIPIGSAINCLGYNDYLEKTIGIFRVAAAFLALIYNPSTKDKAIMVGHIVRGILEFRGCFEKELLILDVAFTVINVGRKCVNIYRASENLSKSQNEKIQGGSTKMTQKNLATQPSTKVS